MNCSRSRIHLHLWERILALAVVVLVALAVQSFGLNTDGILLLSFKLSILSDPLSALASWNSYDQTPCYWNGVTCADVDGGASDSRVTALSLPSSQLLGSIPSDLGMIEHLQILNLSNNSINSTLPVSIFNATELRVIDLSNNLVTGEVPETIGRLQSLQVLNLSDNALAGKLPASLTTVQNLTAVSLKNNYFSGGLPGGFRSVQFLDLSSNLLNGSLPSDFGGVSIRFLNVSYNRLFGRISPEFAAEIPSNATVDLSFNNLTGEVPDDSVFTNQDSDSFSGNSDLCGEIIKRPCPIPSSPSSFPNVSGPTSPPALAAIPNTIGSSSEANSSTGGQQQQPSRLKPAAIVGIVVGDVALVGILAVIFFIVYKLRKKRKVETTLKQEAKTAKDDWSLSSSSSESRGFRRWSCLRKKGEEEESETASETEEGQAGSVKSQENQRAESEQNKKGTLVTVDGTKELELETLLKASAYILGATGSSIMYKAVLEDGTALAVRRIGEGGVDRFRDFESQVRVIAKLVHPNLVRIRGFFWGVDEKLVIYDFVPNGSLANARFRNSDLCGEIIKRPCPIPSSPSSFPNVSGPTSPPALAAIPNTIGSSSEANSSTGGQQQQPSRLKPAAIVGIVVGDVALVGILAVIFFIVYKLRKKRKVETTLKQEAKTAKDDWSLSSSSSESRGFRRWSCLRKKGEEEESETASETEEGQAGSVKSQENQRAESEQNKKGTLVTVDGTKELELETLLKASAYILGATGSSIMYKAVLEDGTALAVRRIGEGGVDRFRDFESQVRVIAKLVHPNLVRIRGFFWGVDEKLVIYDFVPNGSLANARFRRVGSSPCHLPWEARLKIAKGVARALAYLHEKRHVHANLKPSNILLGSDMEPKIGDFGLERLLTGDMSYKGGSTRNFGSNRSTASRDSLLDFAFGASPSPSPSSLGVSPYVAPESLRSLKPNPKWDVFSFGVILLELLSGKVIVVDELGQGNGLAVEDKTRALRMADVAIRAELEGKEDALLACFKLGFSCASPIPQKRPTMKDALQVIEKFPSSSSSYHYGH